MMLPNELVRVVEKLGSEWPDIDEAGDSGEFYADLQALEDARTAMQVHGADIQSLTSTFFAEFSALNFGGD